MIAVLRKAKSISGVFVIVMALFALCRDAQGQCEGQWAEGLSSLPGLDGTVKAMTVFNDGSGDALYVGGYFTVAGETVAANIARWDGSSWSALGSGVSRNYGGEVDALTVFDDGSGPALYAGGDFTTAGGVSANNIAKWNGSTWSALGSGIVGDVYALTVFDDGSGPALFAGGNFSAAGDVSTKNIAKWDGSSWSALGSGVNSVNAYVSALTAFDDGGGPALYAGGDFTTAGGVSANYIAKWDGASWSALGSGVSRYVYALTVFDDGGGPALYAGGWFATAGGVSAKNIAKWNGSSWSALGTGLDWTVRALTVFDDGGGPALYAGGQFDTAGGLSAMGIAEWDGASWSGLGSGICCNVYGSLALTVLDDGAGPALYAGGDFSTAGGIAANRIAKWDGVTWSALNRSVLGAGINGPAYALTILDDGGGPALYAGGYFSTAGGVSANNIAKWDGSSWSALGSGVNPGTPYSSVQALTVFDDGGGPALYAGGNFSTAGGVYAYGIAKWDGASWSALGSGLRGFYPEVYALTVFDDGGGPALYAAAGYTVCGMAWDCQSYYYVAQWDGSNWSELGSGMSGAVRALTVFDDGGGPALYAGGEFSSAGGVIARGIAKWDGSSWSALGSGMGWSYQSSSVPYVFALTVFDEGEGPALYAGGPFSTAGGVSTNHIAKWDGSNWSALGSGMDDIIQPYTPVAALTVFDDGGGPALYAGGYFTTAGGISSNHIAKWDGTSWSALGSGMRGFYYSHVSSLTIFDNGGGPALYAGGSFTTAGGNVSAYFARWSSHPETDASGFAVGMTGPVATPECKPYDYDCDGDVDLQDYARLLFRVERN